MTVAAFDASYLIPLFDPQVIGAKEDARLMHLIATLDKQRDVIIIPTPALSELLIGAGDAAPKYLELVHKLARVRIAVFGERAAVEAAARHREARDAGDKKEGTENWAKVKFDRQIVAIAKVENADRIYSNDPHIVKYGRADGIKVIMLDELDEPPERTPDLFDSPKPNRD